MIVYTGTIMPTLGTCESFFSFELNLESNRPYTTQAVTQPNGLQGVQAYRTAYTTACYTYSEYLIHLYL